MTITPHKSHSLAEKKTIEIGQLKDKKAATPLHQSLTQKLSKKEVSVGKSKSVETVSEQHSGKKASAVNVHSASHAIGGTSHVSAGKPGNTAATTLSLHQS